jgi:hypothetical protein
MDGGGTIPGMTRYAQERIRGSLWSNGILGMVAGGVMVVGLLIMVPPIRWFLAIAVVIGLGMAGIIHWYNEHVPVKVDEDKIVLHLNDDTPLPPMKDDDSR